MTKEQGVIAPRDIEMLFYFWTQKEDVEGYGDWDVIQADLERRFPAVAAAWRGYIAGGHTLTAAAVIEQGICRAATERPMTASGQACPHGVAKLYL